MAQHRIGIIMHGVTGRMGKNQHLIRSIVAIREQGGVELANGQRVTVASEEQAYAFARQAGSEPVRIARRAQSLLVGTAESVLEQLNALHEKWGIDEFIIDTPVAEGAARVASLRLLAEARLNKEVTV